MGRPAGFLIFLLNFCLAAALSASSPLVDSALTNRLLEIQSAILDDQFDLADSLSNAVIADLPENPSGYISSAASQLARMTDAEENLYGKTYVALLDSITALCNREVAAAQGRDKAWLYLFLGHAQAYRALYESKFGSSYKAIRMGLRTNDSYEAGLKADSTLHDLYFGLGSYHYWKSVKAGMFRWIGLFRNDIELGIGELRRAADSSLLSQNVARASLAWVWLDREQFDSVVAEVEPLATTHPTGKSFLWPLARARFEMKQYREAMSVYTRIRSLTEANPGNHFNIVECDYYIARCYEKMKNEPEAARWAARLAGYEKYISAESRVRQADKMSHLRRLGERAVTTVSIE
jgi:hypothetical protein